MRFLGVGFDFLPQAAYVDVDGVAEDSQSDSISLWKNGDRFDLQLALASAMDNADDWTGSDGLVTLTARLSDR